VKKLVFILPFLVQLLYAQSRNEQVRELNTIIDYMDESSRINRELYWDIKQFAEGYIHSSGPKKNNNYWYTNAKPGSKIGYFDGAERFPEMHVDAERMVIDFEYILYPYLLARETMDKLSATKFLDNKDSIKMAYTRFKTTMDSLVILHHTLYEYVTNKNYLADPEFKTALSIIAQTSRILDTYHENALVLYHTIYNYYQAHLAPLKTQKRMLLAEQEAWKIMDELEQWEVYLFGGDISLSHAIDSTIRYNNDQSLAKDSLLFFGSYGYKASNNGAMPHTRYCDFFGMMKSTLYWYAKDKYQYPEFMKKSDINYNEFVDRTHMSIEDYNDLIECADGKQLCKNMEYSMKMAAQAGVDTNQNVLLKFPRWAYIFHFVKKQEEQEKPVVHEEKKDTVVITEHQQLINRSVPHHMVFLLDVSASMHDPGKLDLLKDGAKYLVGLQRKVDHISLLTFSTHSHTLLRNVACDQKENIYKKIDELQAKGATNASDGITNSFNIADSNKIEGKNKIILVTDGKFQLDAPATKLLNSFKKKNIELVILLINEKEDPTLDKELDAMSRKGNGRYYKVVGKNVEEVLIKEAAD
jgi:hypothetical protein